MLKTLWEQLLCLITGMLTFIGFLFFCLGLFGLIVMARVSFTPCNYYEITSETLNVKWVKKPAAHCTETRKGSND